MKTFIENITYFVLIYPLVMALLWTIGGFLHKFKKRKVENFKEELPLIILVPVYNEEKNIKQNLENNLDLNYNNFIIYAIDDCSNDNSVNEILKINNNKLKIIKNNKNIGKAATLNNVVQLVDSDYFVVIDSDTILEENSLQMINNQIQQDILEGKNNTIAGYTGNITVHSDNKNKVFRMQKIEYRAFIDMIKRSQSVALHSIMTLSGACSIYNKEIFKKIGQFSETNATEDINISWRLNMLGYKLSYIDDIYSSVTTPGNVYDLIMQRKRWTNGLLQTIFKYKNDFIKLQNINLKIYTIEIFLSSIWAILFALVNVYYIIMLFTYHVEDISIYELIFPTIIMFIASILLAVSSYNISNNDRESVSDFIKHYWFFPFVYFYIQPIGFILGYIETIKKHSNERWRSKNNVKKCIAFSTIIDVICSVVLVELLLEIFKDINIELNINILSLYIVCNAIFVIIYYNKINLGSKCINLEISGMKNPALYITLIFLILEWITYYLILVNIVSINNIYEIGIISFIFVILSSIFLFNIIYKLFY